MLSYFSSPRATERVERNAARIEEPAKVMHEYGRKCASGYLYREFSLSISRPGCEFVSDIRPAPNSRRSVHFIPTYHTVPCRHCVRGLPYVRCGWTVAK
ncbi:hypothetical protein BV20DRAFT_971124 [Pilatotrama ljubarskyi]|nr:hypothetical protein BV20DRAFT_971124 [Pilatotrama ljubarskyi]